MDPLDEELIKTSASSTSRDVMHFCMSNVFRGFQGSLSNDEQGRLNECLKNFSYSYVIVADSWMSYLGEQYKQAQSGGNQGY